MPQGFVLSDPLFLKHFPEREANAASWVCEAGCFYWKTHYCRLEREGRLQMFGVQEQEQDRVCAAARNETFHARV